MKLSYTFLVSWIDYSVLVVGDRDCLFCYFFIERLFLLLGVFIVFLKVEEFVCWLG